MARITFGMIVLNGYPFIEYNLRGLYPHAHQIIVVEGACRGAENIAREDGHSSDGTLELLRCFKKNCDPEDKLVLVTAEDEGHSNGFWPGEKHEQSRAYAKRANGDFLWQVDVDEFYKDEDIAFLSKYLDKNSSIDMISFRTINFWGGFEYVCDGWALWDGQGVFRRLFRWAEGYEYFSHRPPTIVKRRGEKLEEGCWVTGSDLRRKKIYLYHYCLVFPKQVADKISYYQNSSWTAHKGFTEWAERVYGRLEDPFRVHNVYYRPSWLERFKNYHPHEIEKLKSDIESGSVVIDLRRTDDIENILSKFSYVYGKWRLKVGWWIQLLKKRGSIRSRIARIRKAFKTPKL